MRHVERTASHPAAERPSISKARGVFALVVGLLLLTFFGKILLDVFPALIASGMSEPATLILVVFSFVLAGLGAGLMVIGYRRLTGGARSVKPYQLPTWVLLSLGVLFLIAGAYGLLVGRLLWGATTTVLGALACRLAWQRRSAEERARL